MQIKKGTLVFLIIAALLIGCFGTVLAVTGGVFGTTLLPNGRYDRLLKYESDYKKLDRIKEFLVENYYTQVDESVLMESVYSGIVSGLDDKYSEYISAEDYDQYLQELMGTETYFGVGITFLNVPIETGFYSVAVNTKGPAYEQGVRKGDIIAKVDGVDALTMDGDTLRDKIRGELGTVVEIELIRGDSRYTVNIERREIPTESVVYEMLEDGVAYIQISSFIEGTDDDFVAAINKAEIEGAKYLVLDLRDNGGGLVASALGVADALMDQGIVVSTLDHNGNREEYTTGGGRTGLPYVVLVNENTASSSEILSAGIQDNGEGLIIGMQTFGKGIIQNIMTMGDGSAVKYTELQYLSPKGNPIHGVGITPDIIIDLTEDCYDKNGFLYDDIQLTKAIEVVKETEYKNR